jgi:hypothetical protein
MTIERPDFEALRAARNLSVLAAQEKMAAEWGVPLQSLRSNFNPESCYCACATHGPCEHAWDGKPWESEDGCGWSTTCSRCGVTSMSHDMRNAP